jgi:DNA-binding MarR family transcriptional regulator
MFTSSEISRPREILRESEVTPAEAQPSREYLLNQVIDILEEVTRSGPRAVSPEWFTLDLSMPQVRVIFLLLQERSLRMSELASALDVSMSRATGLVDRLVAKELVSRWPDQEDRRSVLYALTEQGSELGHGLLAARRSRWEERLASPTQAELKKVCKAMELIRRAARREVHQNEPLPTEGALRR